MLYQFAWSHQEFSVNCSVTHQVSNHQTDLRRSFLFRPSLLKLGCAFPVSPKSKVQICLHPHFHHSTCSCHHQSCMAHCYLEMMIYCFITYGHWCYQYCLRYLKIADNLQGIYDLNFENLWFWPILCSLLKHSLSLDC